MKSLDDMIKDKLAAKMKASGADAGIAIVKPESDDDDDDDSGLDMDKAELKLMSKFNQASSRNDTVAQLRILKKLIEACSHESYGDDEEEDKDDGI